MASLVVDVVNPIACRIWDHHWFFDMEKLDGPLPVEGDELTETEVEEYWYRNRAEICSSCCARRQRPLQEGQ